MNPKTRISPLERRIKEVCLFCEMCSLRTFNKFKMSEERIKTYWWFWIQVPIYLFFSFIHQDSKLNMSEVKWNSEFPLNFYAIPLSVFLFFSGFGYLFKTKKINIKLSRVHLIFISSGLLILTLPNIMFIAGPPRRYYSNTIEPTLVEFFFEMNYLSLFSTFLIILGTITYFINLGMAIFKNKT